MSATPVWSGAVPLLVTRPGEACGALVEATISLAFQRDAQAASTTTTRRLEVCVTAESDVFFLYTLGISEDDFVLLKNNQGLLIDFSVFPNKLVELISACRSPSENQNNLSGVHNTKEGLSPLASHSVCSNGSSNRFVARLYTESGPGPKVGATFSIVETNSFRQIIHLSLAIEPATDAALQRHLANLVTKQKERALSLASELCELRKTVSVKLSDDTQTILQIQNQLDNLKITNEEEKRETHRRYTSEIAQLCTRYNAEIEAEKLSRETLLRSSDDIRSNEKLRQNAELNAALLEAQQAVSETSAANRRAAVFENRLESRDFEFCDLKKKFSTTAIEIQNLNIKLESKLNELTRTTEERDSLRSREAESKYSLSKSDKEAGRLRERLETATKAGDNFQQKLIVTEEALRSSATETSKANDIIARLQGALKASSTRAKLKGVVTVQQEKLLDERAQKLSQFEDSISRLQQRNVELDLLYAKKSSECSKLENELNIFKQSNTEQLSMIGWLNGQLNEDILQIPCQEEEKLPFKSKIDNFHSTSELMRSAHYQNYEQDEEKTSRTVCKSPLKSMTASRMAHALRVGSPEIEVKRKITRSPIIPPYSEINASAPPSRVKFTKLPIQLPTCLAVAGALNSQRKRSNFF